MNFSAGSIPEVNVGPEGDGQVVVLAPVHEVEVIVVNYVRGVQDALGDLGDVARELFGGLGLARAVENLEVIAVTLWGRGRLGLKRENPGGAQISAQIFFQNSLIFSLFW